MLKRFFSTNNDLKKQVEELKKQLSVYQVGWPPGHFYSPVPDLQQIRKRESEIWKKVDEIPGVDLREGEQLQLLNSLSAYYSQQPWSDHKKKGYRYYFQNPNYMYGESIILFCMLLHFKPQQVIEIGSGYSSCALLDTNEHFLNNEVNTSFIEPYPDLLNSLIKPEDKQRIKITPSNLQEVDIEVFKSLNAGDFLIIDSTHVSKIDSDVNYILFHILPSLKEGVYIHFHDIMFPFEYPREWIFQGRAWNELYILRAFLQYNSNFEIVYFNSMMGIKHHQELAEKMPLCGKNAGTSIWLRKKSK